VKLKGCHFGTVEVFKAETQAVLSTLTEHNFQDAYKKWQKHWELCIRGLSKKYPTLGWENKVLYLGGYST
jgi:hypothetical protein